MRSNLTARRCTRAVATLSTLLGLSCAWVALTPEGEGVSLRATDAVAECERLGRTRARTKTSVGIFARGEAKVREEQEFLARNEAARMGGNAIAPENAAGGEERTFGVYRCP